MHKRSLHNASHRGWRGLFQTPLPSQEVKGDHVLVQDVSYSDVQERWMDQGDARIVHHKDEKWHAHGRLCNRAVRGCIRGVSKVILKLTMYRDVTYTHHHQQLPSEEL